jgi:hypothetical protein
MIELILEVRILFMYRKWNHVLKFILIIQFILPHLINSVLIFFMLHQCRHHEGSNNGLPRGMKCYPT